MSRSPYCVVILTMCPASCAMRSPWASSLSGLGHSVDSSTPGGLRSKIILRAQASFLNLVPRSWPGFNLGSSKSNPRRWTLLAPKWRARHTALSPSVKPPKLNMSGDGAACVVGTIGPRNRGTSSTSLLQVVAMGVDDGDAAPWLAPEVRLDRPVQVSDEVYPVGCRSHIGPWWPVRPILSCSSLSMRMQPSVQRGPVGTNGHLSPYLLRRQAGRNKLLLAAPCGQAAGRPLVLLAIEAEVLAGSPRTRATRPQNPCRFTLPGTRSCPSAR